MKKLLVEACVLAAIVFSVVVTVDSLIFDWQSAPAALCQYYLRSAVNRAGLSGVVALLAWLTIPRRKFFEWYIPITIGTIIFLTGYMAFSHAWPYSAAAAGVAAFIFCNVTTKMRGKNNER